jgi:alanyl-tRNA synthetase
MIAVMLIDHAVSCLKQKILKATNMTIQLYLEDTYLLHSESLILHSKEDESGVFIILDQTVFYPQGGGQPYDQGIIKNDHFETQVILVRQINDEIRHYITSPHNEIPTGSKVNCIVNQEIRLLNSRYHTAAHLLGNIVEMIHPKLKAVKGHSFPGEAYVEFQGDDTVDPIIIQEAVNQSITKNDKTIIFEIDPISFEQKFYKLPYSVPENKKFRVMQIGDKLPVPCGGTHLSFISEIGKVSIGKIKAKNNIARICYEVR